MGKKIILFDPQTNKASELAEFATHILNLEGINYRLGAENLIAKIRESGYTKDYFEIDDENDDLEGVEILRTEAEKGDGLKPRRDDEEWGAFRLDATRRMVIVLINNQEGAGGNQPVPLSPNGSLMFVPRGKRVAIPYEHFEVLRNAERAEYEQNADLSLIYPPKLVPIHPYGVYHIDPPLESAGGPAVPVRAPHKDVSVSRAVPRAA